MICWGLFWVLETMTLSLDTYMVVDAIDKQICNVVADSEYYAEK